MLLKAFEDLLLTGHSAVPVLGDLTAAFVTLDCSTIISP